VNEHCECPARAALEALKGAGVRTVIPGSVLISDALFAIVIDSLSEACPCVHIRVEAECYRQTTEQQLKRVIPASEGLLEGWLCSMREIHNMREKVRELLWQEQIRASEHKE